MVAQPQVRQDNHPHPMKKPYEQPRIVYAVQAEDPIGAFVALCVSRYERSLRTAHNTTAA